MNTSKIYQDSQGNECSISQMVKREPEWAANRVQEGEKAIERMVLAKSLLEEAKRLLIEYEDESQLFHHRQYLKQLRDFLEL